jgi:hypothetical protein
MDQKPLSTWGEDSSREALVEALPEALRGVARGLLVAEEKGEGAKWEALQRFSESGFSKPEHLVECAFFLTRFYAADEGFLAKCIGVQEMVQELSYGGGALTGVVAEWWMRQRDLVRLVRLVDGLLAAKLHLRTPDCLNVMLALTCSVALHKPQRGAALLAHVEVCEKEAGKGGVNEELLAAARQRMMVAEVVAAADHVTREMWDQRLQKPRGDWTWSSARERKALSDLGEWLTPGHPAEKVFAAVVPPAWWDLWTKREYGPRQGDLFAGYQENKGEEATVGGWAPDHLAGADELPLLEDQMAGAIETMLERKIRLQWFSGGLMGGLLVAGLVFLIWGGSRQRGPGAVDRAELEQIIGPGQDWMAWRLDELRGLAGDVMLVGGMESLRGGLWADNAALLMGRTVDLPIQSLRYRRILAYLHLDPPLDPEVRVRVPRLLLDCAPDEDSLRLWERCLLAGLPLKREIALAAQEALGRPALRWNEGQRNRLTALAGGAPRS